MKRTAALLLLLLTFSFTASAQRTINEAQLVGLERTYTARQIYDIIGMPVCATDPPTGSCTTKDTCIDDTNDQIYHCIATAWQAVGGGGGGGPADAIVDCPANPPSGACTSDDVCVDTASAILYYCQASTWGVMVAGDLSCADCVALTTETTGNYASSAAEGGDADGLVCTDCVALTTETTGNYASSASEGGAADDLACTDCVGLVDMLNIATDSFIGRDTAATGDPEVLSAATARTVLNVENGAAADQSDAEIKTAYENNANTNEFSDAEQTNLANQSGTNTGDEPDATGAVKGIVQLAGDLGGTAASPTVVGVQANSVTLTTDTVGTYVDGVTASQGIQSTGGEGADVALIDCAGGQILKRNVGDTLWECSADDAGGGGANSFETWNADAGTDPVADSATDTMIFAGTQPIITTGSAAADSLTLSFDGVISAAIPLDLTNANPTVDWGIDDLNPHDLTFSGRGDGDDSETVRYLFDNKGGAGTTDFIVDVNETEVNLTALGATMRLGAITNYSSLDCNGTLCMEYQNAAGSNQYGTGSTGAQSWTWTGEGESDNSELFSWVLDNKASGGTTDLTIAMDETAATITATGSTLAITADVTCTDCITLNTETAGDYIESVTASQGLATGGTENLDVGLQDCAANEVLKRNGGDTAWICGADLTGGTINSFETMDASSGTDPVADSATDTLIMTGTDPIVVTGDSSADSLTFSLAGKTGAGSVVVMSDGPGLIGTPTLAGNPALDFLSTTAKFTFGDGGVAAQSMTFSGAGESDNNELVTITLDNKDAGGTTSVDFTIDETASTITATGSTLAITADVTCTDCIALTTETSGDYVDGVTASQGLATTGGEGADLSLIDCAANEILKRNAGDTLWACAIDAGGGGNSFETWDAPAGTDPVADSATDTMELIATAPVTITGDSTLDRLTFDVSDATAGTEGVLRVTNHLGGTAASPTVVDVGCTDCIDASEYLDTTITIGTNTTTDPQINFDGSGGNDGDIRWDESLTRFNVSQDFKFDGQVGINNVPVSTALLKAAEVVSASPSTQARQALTFVLQASGTVDATVAYSLNGVFGQTGLAPGSTNAGRSFSEYHGLEGNAVLNQSQDVTWVNLNPQFIGVSGLANVTSAGTGAYTAGTGLKLIGLKGTSAIAADPGTGSTLFNRISGVESEVVATASLPNVTSTAIVGVHIKVDSNGAGTDIENTNQFGIHLDTFDIGSKVNNAYGMRFDSFTGETPALGWGIRIGAVLGGTTWGLVADDDIAVTSDNRFLMEGSETSQGDSYMRFDSTDTDIEITVDGAQVIDIDNDGIDFATAVAHGANYVDINNLATPANPAAGTRRIFVDTGGVLSVRTSGGSTVSLEAGAAGGETNTGSNQGTDGVGVFDTKAGVDLQFRHVAPGSSKITTTLNVKDIDIDVVEANLTHDSIGGTLGIAKGGTGQTAQTAAFDALGPGTTKGDLIVHNGTDHIRVGVGTNTFVLTANSGDASGVNWATLAETIAVTDLSDVGGKTGTGNQIVFSGAPSLTALDISLSASVVTFGDGGVGEQSLKFSGAAESDDAEEVSFIFDNKDSGGTTDLTILMDETATTIAATGSTLGITADVTCTSCITLATETAGNYVDSVTASQGLVTAGSENLNVGLIDCAANQVLARNGGDTAWACSTPAGGANVKSGTINVTEGTPGTVTFGTAFSGTPFCTCSLAPGGVDMTCWQSTDASTTAVSWSVDNSTGGSPTLEVQWICTDAGDP